MRTFLGVLGVLVLGLAASIMFGMVSIDQTRPAMVQAPRFQADVGRVSMGTENATVAVPTLQVERPADAPAAN